MIGIETRDELGRTDTLTADIVIGADGRRSTFANHVGAATTHAATNTSAFVYGYWSDLDTNGYEWAYRPGVSAGFIPTNDGQTCVFTGAQPGDVGRGGRSVLESIIRRASPHMAARLRAAQPPTAVRTFTGQPGHLREAWGPGWAIVGDAGSWKDPISAHGLTDAFRDAEMLATAVIAAATGEIPEDEAFTDFEATRDRLTLPIIRAADEIAAFRWDDTRIVELLFEINAAMTDEVALIAGLEVPRTQPTVGRDLAMSA